jgi:putative chitinase
VPSLLNIPKGLAERVYGLGNPKKARELGNLKPGDGYRYRGGGLLQTTDGSNYLQMGRLIGVALYDEPNLIVAPQNALGPALKEWDNGHLNDFADRNGIRTITRMINGGYNGLQGREAFFGKILSIFQNGDASKPPAWQTAKSDENTRWIQGSLNDLGADPPVLVDGKYGPETVAAVEWLQSIANLKVDGIAGNVTRAAMKRKLGSIRAG